MEGLTRRQKEILDFIKSYLREHGYPPTMREIGKHFGFTWLGARGHLRALEKKGIIKVNPLKARGLEVIGLGHKEGLELPVAGRIRAGKLILAIEDIEEHILIDKSLFNVHDGFALRVTGDSMIEVGILDGDYVVVRPQNTIDDGKIGAVLIGDDATVKRVFKDKGKLILKPENRNMKPASYSPAEVTIMGKVMGVIRKI